MPDAIAATPQPPYVAVIFTSTRNEGDEGDDGYAAMSDATQPGYLGQDSARNGVGITVSYWVDEQAALGWKHVAAHLGAQRRGRSQWYADYTVRVATVSRAYTLASSTRLGL